ncbi:histone-lysine n-methyltransferase suvr3 [Quercus suber]|uniref:Histone-lysine n-methyltransferase suvr3 n=1 Tax=Quercus suber TaxID=58331 RepID=A0AAW0LTG5_QUESU
MEVMIWAKQFDWAYDNQYVDRYLSSTLLMPIRGCGQQQGLTGFSISASQLGVEPVSLVDELGHSVSGCDCERCDNEDPDGCPCFSEMDELDIGNKCGPSSGCRLECENRLTQRGVSVGLGYGGDQCWVGASKEVAKGDS